MPAARTRIVALVFCLACPIAAPAEGRGRDASLKRRVGALVGAAFKATKCPGLSVAVASRGRVVYSGAFGAADLENGVRLTTRRAHRLASLSQPATGVIVMGFVGEGRSAPDPPVHSGSARRRER